MASNQNALNTPKPEKQARNAATMNMHQERQILDFVSTINVPFLTLVTQPNPTLHIIYFILYMLV